MAKRRRKVKKVARQKRVTKKPVGKKPRPVKKFKKPSKRSRFSIKRLKEEIAGKPKSKTKISQRVNRKKGEYKITWQRKDRSQNELENILREINYKDLVKKFPKTKFVNVTIFGKFGSTKVGRTYSAKTDYFTPSAIENFLFGFIEDAYKDKLNYGVKKSVRWRNFIEEITFNKFKTNEPRKTRKTGKKVRGSKGRTGNRKRKT